MNGDLKFIAPNKEENRKVNPLPLSVETKFEITHNMKYMISRTLSDSCL